MKTSFLPGDLWSQPLSLFVPQSLTPSPPREGRSQAVTGPPKEKVPRVTTDTSDQIILKGEKGVAEEALSRGISEQTHGKQLDAKLLHVWNQARVSVPPEEAKHGQRGALMK